MIILGIDPGLERMGCAILKRIGSKEILLYSTCVITSRKISYAERLLCLAKALEKIMNDFKPDILSVEKLFFAANQKTAMQIAEVRGIILYLAAKKKIPVKEYTPLQIKSCLTGYGRAEKFQVQKMVCAMLNIKTPPKYDDEMDAIATAITCN
jgi:crossover junction endodeoxyribonuclease RuvC